MPPEGGYPWERPLGARPIGADQVEFRIWAPHVRSISLLLGRSEELALTPAGFGVHELVARARAGDDYRFLADGRRLPDP
jgi:maltooligosyltrehalose trehalohydrolase